VFQFSTKHIIRKTENMKIAQLIFAAAMAMLPCICSAENDKKPLTPKEYAELHNAISDEKDFAKWLPSVFQLAKDGDAYSMEHYKVLITQLDGCYYDQLHNALVEIEDRVKKEDTKAFTQLIEARLERAAYVDLRCDPLEMTLTPWTLKVLGEHLEQPGVKAELTRILSDYSPKDEKNEVDTTTRDRVRAYVKRLLEK
jgi:hypothetical protein